MDDPIGDHAVSPVQREEKQAQQRNAPLEAIPDNCLEPSLFGPPLPQKSPPRPAEQSEPDGGTKPQTSTQHAQNMHDFPDDEKIMNHPTPSFDDSQASGVHTGELTTDSSIPLPLPPQTHVPEKRNFSAIQMEEHQEEPQKPRQDVGNELTIPPLDQPAKRRKPAVKRRPATKNVREVAERRKVEQHEFLKAFVRKKMLEMGPGLKPEDMPAPRPSHRRLGKIDAAEDDDVFFDPNAPEPALRQLSSKETLKEISGAVVESGFNNRRSGSQAHDMREAIHTFGYGKVKCFKLGGEMLFRLSGVETLLKSFQLTGVDWMVRRETDDCEHRGGLFSDSMGFGKTIQALSTIVSNPPSLEDIEEGYQATLVIVPNETTAKQWQSEINKHLSKEHAASIFYKKSQTELFWHEIVARNIV